MKRPPKEDTTLAGLCFALALAIALVGIYVLFTPARYLVAALLGIALIFVCAGRQQLDRLRLSPPKFQSLMRNLGIFVLCTAVLGIVITMIV